MVAAVIRLRTPSALAAAALLSAVSLAAVAQTPPAPSAPPAPEGPSSTGTAAPAPAPPPMLPAQPIPGDAAPNGNVPPPPGGYSPQVYPPGYFPYGPPPGYPPGSSPFVPPPAPGQGVPARYPYHPPRYEQPGDGGSSSSERSERPPRGRPQLEAIDGTGDEASSPLKRQRLARRLKIAGAATAGGSWGISVVSGLLFGGIQGLNGKEPTGLVLAVPLAGPFIGIGAFNGAALYLAIMGGVQVAGLGLLIAGAAVRTGPAAAQNAPADTPAIAWTLQPTVAPNGGGLALSATF
jgi:hypothetical protein